MAAGDATPLHWDEQASPRTRPAAWTLRTLPRRLERDRDPWRDISSQARALGRPNRRLDYLRRETRSE
jgi:bifunctional non-homologous end joining protein LigD